MGGYPSKGTPKDMRKSANRKKSGMTVKKKMPMMKEGK